MMPADSCLFEWSFADSFDSVEVFAQTPSGGRYARRAWRGMPRLQTGILNCCFYLYKKVEHAKNGSPFGGTGFIIGIMFDTIPGYAHTIGVTNWHVAVRDGCSVVRVNTHHGTTEVLEYDPSEWLFRPRGHDLAIKYLDVEGINWNSLLIDKSMILTRDEIDKLNIGPGEDVFMIGRPSH